MSDCVPSCVCVHTNTHVLASLILYLLLICLLVCFRMCVSVYEIFILLKYFYKSTK